MKNPFGFELVGVIIKDQMRKFLKFIHDDVVYCKYYEVVFILFHTGMRISEFCGLTIKDLDMEKRIIDINKQCQRTKMDIHIETTKTNVGTRKIPMTDDVYEAFKAILEDIVMHDEPLFFILELPVSSDREKPVAPGIVEELHKDVYYIDGCTREEALVLMERYGELLINDGISKFGFGCHESQDEIMLDKYNVVTIYSQQLSEYDRYFSC